MMRVKIEIECETMTELYTHIDVIVEDMKKEVQCIDDEPQGHYSFSDDNCYGTHFAMIKDEEE